MTFVNSAWIVLHVSIQAKGYTFYLILNVHVLIFYPFILDF